MGHWPITVQRGALGLTQGFVISFHVNSTSWWAILLLLCSHASSKKLVELLERKVQNLYVRPTAPPLYTSNGARALQFQNGFQEFQVGRRGLAKGIFS